MIRELKPKPSEGDLEIADSLRDLADKLEAGDVCEVVLVANLRAEGSYLRLSKFDDAWKLLGALE
jgi:hypothetical protein